MNLQKALNLWAEAGHTQRDFARLTGIEGSVVSRIFKGERSLTMNQRLAIFRAFRDQQDLHQGLIILRADLEERIPEEARQYLKIILDEPLSLAESSPASKETATQKAKRKFIAELEADEPQALDLVRALYDWEEAV